MNLEIGVAVRVIDYHERFNGCTGVTISKMNFTESGGTVWQIKYIHGTGPEGLFYGLFPEKYLERIIQ